MDKKEVLELSEKHTSQFGYLAQCGEDATLAFVEFSVESLIDFANACEKAGMEKAAKICESRFRYADDANECAEAIREAT